MKFNPHREILIISLFTTTWLLSCQKEKETDNTAANRIAASEQLFIPAEVALPDNPPAGNERVATYYAEGVQKYRAQAKPGGGFEWVFVAPRADLFDNRNHKSGTHGAGPFWAVNSTDSIFAQAFSPARTATPDPGSIPWLLLMPKTGKTPGGIFTNVAYIQRIATTGGKAPATAPLSISDTADVFYTAIYRFSRIK